MTTKSSPELWERVKRRWYSGDSAGAANTWNARKAQLAVAEYKRLGGTYKSPKSKSSLNKWTEEDWGYVADNPNGRYLPKAVRDQLTPTEKRITNRNKHLGTKQGKSHVPWEPFVVEKFNKYTSSKSKNGLK